MSGLENRATTFPSTNAADTPQQVVKVRPWKENFKTPYVTINLSDFDPQLHTLYEETDGD